MERRQKLLRAPRGGVLRLMSPDLSRDSHIDVVAEPRRAIGAPALLR